MRSTVALLGLSSVAAVITVAGCVLVTGTGNPGGAGAGGPGGASFSGYVCQGPATPPSGGSCVNVSGDAGPPPDLDGGMNQQMDAGHHSWDGGHGFGSSSGSGNGGSGSGSSSGSGTTGSGGGGGSGSSSSGSSSSGSSSSGAPNASCNPLTNAGCAGADVCGPDGTGTTYVCQPEGSPANLAACGDCSDPSATCGVGGVCVTLDTGNSICVEMCCTDADCGAGQCNTSAIIPSLPDAVGVCVLP